MVWIFKNCVDSFNCDLDYFEDSVANFLLRVGFVAVIGLFL